MAFWNSSLASPDRASPDARADALFRLHQQAIYRRTDRLFIFLMLLQYAFGVFVAFYVSPRTWAGGESSVHLHVWAALFLGGLIISLPMGLALFLPGHALTRYVIAVGQMLYSALLIHLMGGRIESHFHIFGVLAILGFYRDWRVIVLASLVTTADHYLRGLYWPQSVFGLLSPESWRWAEHTGWVIFEGIFIIVASRQSLQEMHEIADRRAHVEQIARDRAQAIKDLEQAREELSAANRAKDTFISICGHELKTPLTSLSLQTQLTQRAMRQGKDVPPERLARVMEQTELQVKRLLRLVQDMLDHSRLQMGRLEIYYEDVNLRSLVRDVVERCHQQAEAVGSALSFADGDPIYGQWDMFRIEQVVTNLVTNAIKYGEGKPITVSAFHDATHATVKVVDQGLGIAPEHQERIFEQFERVGDTQRITGLGLGLFITQGIVERHGGEILVESQEGQGSSFTVRLPLRPSLAGDAEDSLSVSPATSADLVPAFPSETL